MKIYLKVLGVFFVFIGGMLFIGGTIETFVISKMISMGKLPLKSFFFMTPKLVGKIEIILGLVIICSSISFWRKKAWSRAFFEFLSWLFLVYMVVSFFYVVWFFVNLPERWYVKIASIAGIFLITVYFGGISIAVLNILRKKEFKELFRRTGNGK